MDRWIYKTTTHRLNGRTMPEGEEALECDESGICLAHDLRLKRTKGLTDVLNREGHEGWELVQCHYHARDLLCIWKKIQ